MFADDLILTSHSAAGFQNCLDKLYQYTSKWGLHVNLQNTQIIIFNKNVKSLNKYKLYYNYTIVEHTRSNCYLGVIFTPSRSFTQARLSDYLMIDYRSRLGQSTVPGLSVGHHFESA